MADTIVTFTSRSMEEILETGGSQAWRLSPRKAKEAKYLVCARNKHSDWSEGPEDHGAGFLVGQISGIAPAPENPARHLIQIDKWARIEMPDLWAFGRNPIHYLDLADLNIDLATLDFQPLDSDRQAVAPPTERRTGKPSPPLSIAEAKRGLAAAFGVGMDAIEITIRG